MSKWIYLNEDGRSEPVSSEVLKSLLDSGRIFQNTMIRNVDSDQCCELNEVNLEVRRERDTSKLPENHDSSAERSKERLKVGQVPPDPEMWAIR